MSVALKHRLSGVMSGFHLATRAAIHEYRYHASLRPARRQTAQSCELPVTGRYIFAYAETLQPATIMQIGCFTATESRWLALKNCPATLVASDFDPARLAYLRQRFAGGPFERIELRALDLEQANSADLTGIDMVVCNAVLSNLQPQGLDRLLAAIAGSAITCVILSDVYTSISLSGNPSRTRSAPSPFDRNWFHPYLALAARHGLAGFFLPDFTVSSFEAVRGNFVLHRQLPTAVHDQAVTAGWRHYLARQPAILADPGPGA
jgi:predicted O-methyltransferase YrrM